MKRPHRLLYVTILALMLTAGSGVAFAREAKPIYTIKIDDYIINPAVEEYIRKSIKAAKGDGQCLIIYLDTPGGLLSSTRNIVKEIMNSEVPIVVYVAPKGARAGSAGVFITLAADVACMAPSTNIGAAHPVQVSRGGGFSELIKELIKYFKKEKAKEKKKTVDPQDQEEILSQKIISDTLAWVAAIAENRGRSVEWAKKAVSESVSVTEKQALKEGIIDFIAEDTHDLLSHLDGRTISTKTGEVTLNTKDAPIKRIDMTFRQSFLNIIANPTLAYILTLLGFYGLLFEFTHPGIGFPGIAGAIAIILGFYGFHTLPTNYAGVALIILAIILFIAETQVASFGLLALGGITCMFLGSIILIDSPHEFMRVSTRVIIPLVLSTAGITIFLATAVIRAHRRRVTSGKEGLIGEIGEALVDFKRTRASGYEGKVFVHGEIWQAKSDVEIKKADTAKVIGCEGICLLVKKRSNENMTYVG